MKITCIDMGEFGVINPMAIAAIVPNGPRLGMREGEEGNVMTSKIYMQGGAEIVVDGEPAAVWAGISNALSQGAAASALQVPR